MDKDTLNRRDFFRTAGAGVTAAAVMLSPRDAALAQEAAQKAALERIASNSWPIRPLFKQRGAPGGGGRAGGAAGAGGGPKVAERAQAAGRRRCGAAAVPPARDAQDIDEQSERGATTRHCHGGCGGARPTCPTPRR